MNTDIYSVNQRDQSQKHTQPPVRQSGHRLERVRSHRTLLPLPGRRRCAARPADPLVVRGARDERAQNREARKHERAPRQPLGRIAHILLQRRNATDRMHRRGHPAAHLRTVPDAHHQHVAHEHGRRHDGGRAGAARQRQRVAVPVAGIVHAAALVRPLQVVPQGHRIEGAGEAVVQHAPHQRVLRLHAAGQGIAADQQGARAHEQQADEHFVQPAGQRLDGALVNAVAGGEHLQGQQEQHDCIGWAGEGARREGSTRLANANIGSQYLHVHSITMINA